MYACRCCFGYAAKKDARGGGVPSREGTRQTTPEDARHQNTPEHARGGAAGPARPQAAEPRVPNTPQNSTKQQGEQPRTATTGQRTIFRSRRLQLVVNF